MRVLSASEIVSRMYDNDPFSRWLGIERVEESPGHCILRMQVREEMTNGFGVAHGGIAYSLADSALAFASNAHGRHALSIETSISHLKPVYAGDVLVAVAREKQLGRRLARYEVEVALADGSPVALFKGTVYRKDAEWQEEQ